jgi:hypothetical protein
MSPAAANRIGPTAAVTVDQPRRQTDGLRTQFLVVLFPLLLTCVGVSGSVLQLQYTSLLLYWPAALLFAGFALTFGASSSRA